MAIKQHMKKPEKKDKKYSSMIKGLSKRRLADNKGLGIYSKYGDIPPSKVHEGVAVFSATDYDPDSVHIHVYSQAVKQGQSKNYFVYRGVLYHITNSSGTTREVVTP